MPLQHGMYEFRSAVEKLREIVTPAVLAEFGEELTADNLRDIMSGGTAIRARMEADRIVHLLVADPACRRSYRTYPLRKGDRKLGVKPFCGR